MDSKRTQKILTMGMLVIITFSLFFIPSVNGNTGGIFQQEFLTTGVGSYVEDFSTQTYYDGASTASGWGRGAVTKGRNFTTTILDFHPTMDPIRGVAVQGRKAYAVEYNV